MLLVDLRRKIRNACDKYVFHTQKRMCMCMYMCMLCVCVCVCVSARKKKRKRKIKHEEKYSSKYCHLDRPAYHRYGLLETLICKCTLMDIYIREICVIDRTKTHIYIYVYLSDNSFFFFPPQVRSIANIEQHFPSIVSCDKNLLKWKGNGNSIQWSFRGKE